MFPSPRTIAGRRPSLRTLVLTLSGLILAFALYAPPAFARDWRPMGGDKEIKFVLVTDMKKLADPSVYRDAVINLCHAGNDCFLLFWADQSMIPKSLPLTVPQAKAQIAVYTFDSKTGGRRFLWNCGIRNEPGACFK